MDNNIFVFVYGTLKTGYRNHHVLRDAVFLGMAETQEQYALYLAAAPCLFKGEQVSRISGEVYEVDLPTLALLDELEDHPHRYIREQVSVILKNGQEMSAWVYFYPRKIGVLEPCGDYAERTANEFGRSE